MRAMMFANLKERSWKDVLILASGLLFFLSVLVYCIATDYSYYIADSIIFIALTLVLYILYDHLKLDSFTFLMLVIAFALHDMGAFRFYANPPVPFDWDIVTHVFGIYAATLSLYNLILAFAKKTHHSMLFFLIILAGLGVGVLIEFVEFYGFITTGFGEGFLGRGFGDYDPAIVSSDYIDTMQDMLWNLVGAVVGFVVGYIKEKLH